MSLLWQSEAIDAEEEGTHHRGIDDARNIDLDSEEEQVVSLVFDGSR